MAVSFTPEQQQVIDLHNCNILVSAAAGSGKTAVLVERIIKMICDGDSPVDIDRLLVLTFTNAAAAEMRERIAAGISARLEEHPESEHLQRQATLLHNAQITTIDSFCLFLLKNHFHEIGLDPAFRIADESELKLLEQDVLKNMLEDGFSSKDPEFGQCVEFFCPGGREAVLEQYIIDLSRFAASFPWPEEWLEERKKDYEDQSAIEDYLLCHISGMLKGCLAKLEGVRELCEQPDGPYMYGETVDREIEKLAWILESTGPEQIGQRLQTMTFDRLPSKKDDSVLPEKRELASGLRGEVKKTVQGLTEKFFRTSPEIMMRQTQACRTPVRVLIDLVLDFNRRMKLAKQEKKIVDFSDVEHFALDILLKKGDGGTGAAEVEATEVAKEYRDFFQEVLVDEYQDSNLVQEYLLKAVSGERVGRYNRFMVGDVKQSIYKFRLARPEIFMEKYESYRADSGEKRRIDLSRNFRSRREVLEGVNQIFERIMNKTMGGVDYDEKAALYPGAVYPDSEGNGCELLLAAKPDKGDEISAKEAESLLIANRIKELRGHFRVTDKATGVLRPVKYSDIVILLRSLSGWDSEMKKVLEEQGIPVHITSRTGYFDAPEIQEILQLLQVLDNPRQDIPLFGVMKSLFGKFTEEEIALIRSGQKKVTLYEALQNYGARYRGEDFVQDEIPQQQDEIPQQGGMNRQGGMVQQGGIAEEVLAGKTAAFLEMISEYRRLTVYLPVRELITRIISDFDYLNYVTALPAGSKRRANVEMLLTRASDFEKSSYYGLFHFVRYMQQLEKYEQDFGEAERLDENADVVRIMSIHKSKGLEFPITIVAGLGKRFNLSDTNTGLVVDMDLGVGVDFVDPVKRIKNATLRKAALALKSKSDTLSEELRILYVALTRAKEKLIMTATVSRPEELVEGLKENTAEQLSYLEFMEASGYLDLILPIIGNTTVRVEAVTGADTEKEELEEQVHLYEKQALLKEAGELADREALERLTGRMHAAYPYERLRNLYTKTTVSELKIAAMADKDEQAFHSFEEKEVVPYIPAFKRGEEKVSGTVRGNAYHRVMELLDFAALLEVSGQERKEALLAYLDKMTADKRLKKEYREAVSIGKILHFLETPLARRMAVAQKEGRLYREQPFVLGIRAGRLGEEFPDSERVLIQGIIDVFFVEEEGLVLLDYKTDVISDLQALRNRYETQLDYYEEALCRMMHMPVKEKLLYSFHLGEYETES